MVCNEKGMYLVVAEHLLNSGEFRFGRNCLWGASHGLADRQIDEIFTGTLDSTADVTIGDYTKNFIAFHHDTQAKFATTDDDKGIR